MKPLALSAVLLLWFWSECVGAIPPRYALQTRGETVRLIDKGTGRIVWARKVSYGEAIWSKDRRAVALTFGGRYLLWREGQAPFAVSNPAIPGSGGHDHYDYALAGAWSPDKRRFLATFGISGMADIGPNGVGRLFCFKLGRHARYSSWVAPSPYYAGNYAGKIAWRDNKTALFWRVKEASPQLYPKPRHWRVP